VKPYRQPHCREIFHQRKEDLNQYYQGKIWILINIHGIGHHKTIIQYDIIRDQQLLRIGEIATIIHGIKVKKPCNNQPSRIKNENN
jgi:hypothetical protein